MASQTIIQMAMQAIKKENGEVNYKTNGIVIFKKKRGWRRKLYIRYSRKLNERIY